MSYQIDVLVRERDKCGHIYTRVWKAIRPTGGSPYEFKTKQEAIQMAEMCYGNSGSEVRVTNKGRNKSNGYTEE